MAFSAVQQRASFELMSSSRLCVFAQILGGSAQFDKF